MISQKLQTTPEIDFENASSPSPFEKSTGDVDKIFTQWACLGNDEFAAAGRTKQKLDAGFYSFKFKRDDVIFYKIDIKIDELIKFPDSISDDVTSEIEKFWSTKEQFLKYKFLHKRGYLFYGPAGSGKSMIVQQIISDIISRDGIAILGDKDPYSLTKALREFRQVEKDRHLVCIFEDIDIMIKDYGEQDLLMQLDGENQIDDVLNIATTNRPEELAKTFLARPRRFDRIVKVNFPDNDMRKVYFEHKLEINGEDIKKWVDRTDNFSFAALADLIISVKCLGISFEEAISKLEKMRDEKISSNDFGKINVGFNP